MSARRFERGSVWCSACGVEVCRGLYAYTPTESARDVLRRGAYEVPSGEVYCSGACLPPGAAGSRVFGPEGTRPIDRGWRAYPALRDLGVGEHVTPGGRLHLPRWAYLAAAALIPLQLNYDDHRAVFSVLLRREELRDALAALELLSEEPTVAARMLLEAELGHLWHWSLELIDRLVPLGGHAPKAPQHG